MERPRLFLRAIARDAATGLTPRWPQFSARVLFAQRRIRFGLWLEGPAALAHFSRQLADTPADRL